MLTETYVQGLLALAPLVIVGLGVRALGIWQRWPTLPRATFLLTALLFASSFAIPRSAGWCWWLSLPWGIWTVWLAASQLFGSPGGQASADRTEPIRRITIYVKWAAFLYLPVGAIWALADRMAYQPLDFAPIIVLLTGVHFHYAGFALPLLCHLWLRQREVPTHLDLFTGWGITLGVPLVAMGITASQLGWPPVVELTAVTLMTAAGGILGMAYACGKRVGLGKSNLLFRVGGICLTLGMVLAWLYGWRYVWPIAWLSIPWMYAVHGSLNSLGFALPTLWAWNIALDEQRKKSRPQRQHK